MYRDNVQTMFLGYSLLCPLVVISLKTSKGLLYKHYACNFERYLGAFCM